MRNLNISNKFIKLVYNDPLIFFTQHHFFRDYILGTFNPPSIFKKDVVLISADNWYWNDNKYRVGQNRLILDGYYKFIERYPKTKVIVMHPDEESIIGYPNIPYIVFNRNALVDINDYFVTNTKIKYNAIYNAVLYKYKRHELAFGIDKLALIYYLRNHNNKIYYINDNEMQYGVELKAKLSNMNNVTLINDMLGYYRYLDKSSICSYYNESKCGLCLSDIEGACLASIEYLLCGIPVITTYNHGGRDVLLKSSGYATYVNDNIDDISNAVDNIGKYNKNDIRKEIINSINLEWYKCKNQLKLIADGIDFDLFKHNMIDAQKSYSPI